MMDLNLGLFASHGGSNVESILDSIERGRLDAEPGIIISNNPDSRVLGIAAARSVPNYCINDKNTDDLEDTILELLAEHDIDLVVLAGYMKRLGTKIVDGYTVLNIHPSLLPKFGGKGMYGMHVHKAVLESGDKESGATIHLVDEEYDRGRILSQYKVPVFRDDDYQSLAERVLAIEHVLYPQTLKEIQKGIIDIGI